MLLKQAQVGSSNTRRVHIFAPFCMSFHSHSLSCSSELAFSASAVPKVENVAVDIL